MWPHTMLYHGSAQSGGRCPTPVQMAEQRRLMRGFLTRNITEVASRATMLAIMETMGFSIIGSSWGLYNPKCTPHFTQGVIPLPSLKIPIVENPVPKCLSHVF